ncbi:flagellin [Roseovarius indicus]|uniref:Flagellin n=1 Tax=Roseovarius indicus TaxID=540747 RepID=A0A0T5PBU0_9RHOB|nr:flagellin [Roseovarius indicus]KRS18581.1 flagellar hook protein [Roseovarius indicus]QEW25597.1 flagellar hook-associated protein FlgL [Roseovarius indicus]SFE02251.1 flagellar hook-associated protein 3 FlgL [Roseovarius indicus]
MTWSVSRLSSLQLNMFSRQFVSRTTQELQTASQEVSSGRRADIFKDLGSRAASTLRLRANEEETQTYLKSNGLLTHKLDAMLTSVDAIRDRVESVMNLAMANASRPSNGASALQAEARAALESVVAILNTTYQSDHLFSGTRSDQSPMTRWSEVNPSSGLSPQDVMADIAAAVPADGASAQAMLDEIDLVFASADTASPARNFEGTFYSGTPALDGAGQPADRVVARISAGQEIEYGVQANDLAFRETLKGLSLLATIDVSTIEDEAAYTTWMNSAIGSLSRGQSGTLDISARIGFHQKIIETEETRLTSLSLVHQMQIAELENVDPYEAVTRMTNLENQLRASYEVSARLTNLSFLNHLR